MASDDPLWKGVFFCCVLLCTTSVQTLMLSQYFYYMYQLGMRVRSAVIAALYCKALRVSPAAKLDSSTGEIVNLMSVDVQRVMDIMVSNLFPCFFYK